MGHNEMPPVSSTTSSLLSISLVVLSAVRDGLEQQQEF